MTRSNPGQPWFEPIDSPETVKEHDISVRRIEEALIPLCDVLDPEEGPVILAFGVKQLAKRLADNLNGVSVEPEPEAKPDDCSMGGTHRMVKVQLSDDQWAYDIYACKNDGCCYARQQESLFTPEFDVEPEDAVIGKEQWSPSSFAEPDNDDLIAAQNWDAAEPVPLKEEQPTCNGNCNTVADLGLGPNEGLNANALAERDPECSLHGTVAVPEKTLREQLHVVIAKRSSADVADVLADECVVVVAENFDSKREEIESLFFSKRWFKDEFSAALRAILLSEKREA